MSGDDHVGFESLQRRGTRGRLSRRWTGDPRCEKGKKDDHQAERGESSPWTQPSPEGSIVNFPGPGRRLRVAQDGSDVQIRLIHTPH